MSAAVLNEDELFVHAVLLNLRLSYGIEGDRLPPNVRDSILACRRRGWPPKAAATAIARDPEFALAKGARLP